ncbi:hypothetical protein E3P89_00395 [Wallemia ichthyophaga]|uniref:PHD-type domain-containing protein n=2 Tax=Wallemia ichthyophaga TaxID=245174 RepID=A0A4T0IEZ2_WALIC|nr:uncharacterized protein J056_000335 [Wallemia ichthyophaga EXF-994]TIA75376.1 hypothetical protein E3P91_00542 [Wallemia ichthyophaga]EOR04972.1 hypothetical protein J056_000335 [Wallemia ichthyophaga EXF-994]TIA84066.1 hypothetical protein E3P98_00408 [Wallemia ichthyophaga]TIB16389.1 hypothetical protein E3P90_00554 [Wallemia ichthyophaga]TIB18048.1 hypothetical protein E3P93_00411 [Wallemia ichthyophaga]
MSNSLETEIMPAPPPPPGKQGSNLYHKLEKLEEAKWVKGDDEDAAPAYAPHSPSPPPEARAGEGQGEGEREREMEQKQKQQQREGEQGEAMPYNASAVMPQAYPARYTKPSTSLAPHVKKSARKQTQTNAHTLNNNHEWCDACGGEGRVIMCDGCDSSFHASCFDPPMDMGEVELGEDAAWYCRTCAHAKSQSHPHSNSNSTQPSHWVGQLCHARDTSNPTSFSLPVGIRNYFVGVETAHDGSYSTSNDSKPVKTDRFGAALTEREAYPTRDKNGGVVRCYRCQGTAAPALSESGDVESGGSVNSNSKSNSKDTPNNTSKHNTHPLITTPSSTNAAHTQWRKMVSCDYCNCYWHLDCLSPPITHIPSLARMWMCPLHAEHAKSMHMEMKNRIPKEHVKEVNKKLERSDSVTFIGNKSKRSKKLDDRLDKEKFHIPERSIQLAFWDKLYDKSGRRSRLSYSKSFLDDEPTINAVDGLMALSKPTASETRKLVRRVMTGRRATLKEEKKRNQEETKKEMNTMNMPNATNTTNKMNNKEREREGEGQEISDSSSLSSVPMSDDEKEKPPHYVDHARYNKLSTIERLLHLKGEKETIEFLSQ